MDFSNLSSDSRYLDLVTLKRASYGKLKLENSSWKTTKSWQTRAFTRHTRVKPQHTLNLQHGRRSAGTLT